MNKNILFSTFTFPTSTTDGFLSKIAHNSLQFPHIVYSCHWQIQFFDLETLMFFSYELQSSHAREFHPCILTEPYVNLSIHTALLVQSQRYKYRGCTNSLFRLLAVILFQNCQSSLAVVSNLETEQASSFAPLPLQELHHYYGLVRHRNLTASKLCAPFTQRPRLPVSIIKARIRVLLSLSRMPHYQ